MKKESAFDRDLSDGFEPELTGEYPQNPDTKNNLIEKKHWGKYQRYIRCAFKARERGESDKADHYLYKAMQEINTLSNWYDTPFVPCSHEYSDKVFALYKQVKSELGVVDTKEGRRGLSFRSYKDEPFDEKKREKIRALEREFRAEEQDPKRAHPSYDAFFQWMKIGEPYCKANKKSEDKYNEIISERDPQSGGYAIYAVKARHRSSYRKIIAAFNRSAGRDAKNEEWFSAKDDLREALSLCRPSKDSMIRDILRCNLSYVCYRSGLEKLNDGREHYAQQDFYDGLAVLRSADPALFQNVESSMYFRDILEACLCRELGDLSMLFGDTVGAYRYYSSILDTPQTPKEHYTMLLMRTFAYQGIAELYLLTGDTNAACENCNEALKTLALMLPKQEKADVPFFFAAATYKFGYAKRNSDIISSAYEKFFDAESEPCAEHVREMYHRLFDKILEKKVVVILPLIESEPEPAAEPIPVSKPKKPEPFVPNITELPGGKYRIAGREVNEEMKDAYLRLFDVALGNTNIWFQISGIHGLKFREKDLLKEAREAYRVYSEDECDDYALCDYCEALEKLVHFYTVIGDIKKAEEKAFSMMTYSEDCVKCARSDVYYIMLARAVYMLGYFRKSRLLFHRALWLSRNLTVKHRISEVMERFDFSGAQEEKKPPDLVFFGECTVENGIDLIKDKSQYRIHEEYTLEKEVFIESLDRLKTKLEEQSEKVEKESYYLFYRPDFFSVNKEKIFYFETKEALALYYIRSGDREQAEKLVNRCIGAKIDLYMTFYYGEQGGEFILRSLAYSYYRLGYITGQQEPMTRAAELFDYISQEQPSEDAQKVLGMRNNLFVSNQNPKE